MSDKITPEMLAPCGVNCAACSAYLDAKRPCPTCRTPDEAHKRKSCIGCEKKKCAFDRDLQWCFECAEFPCTKLKSMNRRYTRDYGVDLIQNGLDARKDMQKFMKTQRTRCTCECGGIIDQHRRQCSECGRAAT